MSRGAAALKAEDAAAAGPRYVYVPTNSPAANASSSSDRAFVFTGTSTANRSLIEAILLGISNPGMNHQTMLVLNGALCTLAIVILATLFFIDWPSFPYPPLRLQLLIFLAITVGLILSVNWLVMRFGTGLRDEEQEEAMEDQEEEAELNKEEEERARRKTRRSAAAKQQRADPSDEAPPSTDDEAKPKSSAAARAQSAAVAAERAALVASKAAAAAAAAARALQAEEEAEAAAEEAVAAQEEFASGSELTQRAGSQKAKGRKVRG